MLGDALHGIDPEIAADGHREAWKDAIALDARGRSVGIAGVLDALELAGALARAWSSARIATPAQLPLRHSSHAALLPWVQ